MQDYETKKWRNSTDFGTTYDFPPRTEYDLIGQVDETSPERVWERMNIGDHGGYSVRSMSVGDVVVIDGKAYIAKEFGFGEYPGFEKTGRVAGYTAEAISHPTGTMTYIVTPNTPSRPGFGLPKQSQSLNPNDWYDKSEYVYVGDAIVGFIYHLMSGAWGYQNLAATQQEEGFSTPEEAKSALLSVVKTAQFDLQVECIVCGSEDVEILMLTNTGYLCDCLECGARFNYEEDEFLEPEEGSDLWWLNQQLQDKNAQSIDVSTENRYHTPPCPECDSGVLRPVDSDGEPIDSFDSPSFDGFECDECGYFTDDVRTAQILPMQSSIECPSCHSYSVSWVDGDETGDTYICDMCDEEFDVMVDASDPFTDIPSDVGIFLD
jgi:transcription elongation factor Elf1